MRVILLLVLLGLVGGAAWALGPGQSEEDKARQNLQVRLDEAAVGIRRMLQAHEAFPFERVVVGRMLDNGQIDVRGQLRRDKRLVAGYGIVDSACAETTAAACWKLVHLEAEGRLVALSLDVPVPAEAAIAAADEIAPASVPDQLVKAAVVVEEASPAEIAPAPEPIAAKALPVSTAAQVEAPPPAPAAPADPDSVGSRIADATDAQPPAATHRVARPVINTRAGPGTNNPVLAKLKAGDRLALLGKQGGWGNFLILDGADGGAEVWAALRLLEAAQ